MRMFIPFSRVASAVVVLLLATVPARSADSMRVGAYDFGYLLSGDVRAKPVQVFDDGRSTYFQFRAGDAVPAIFSAHGGLPQLLVPTQEGPYVRVPEINGRFVLQVGWAQANVIHGGRPEAPQVKVVAPSGLAQPFQPLTPVPPGGRLVASLTPVPMTFGEDQQAVDRNSYATPVKGDKVYWPERTDKVEHSIGFTRGQPVLSRTAQRELVRIAEAASGSARFTVIGRDDDTYKEGLERARAEALRDRLIKAGIASDRITVRTGVAASAKKGKLWESTVAVETWPAAPVMRQATQIAADAAQGALANTAIAANVQALVRSGALKPEEARALLGRQALQLPQSVSAAAQVESRSATAWEVRKADGTVAQMLHRWALDAGWRLVWRDGPSITVTGDAQIERPTFLDAATYVISHSRNAGYRIKATAYSNNTIVVESE